MKVITDPKPIVTTVRIIDIEDKREPYALVDAEGNQLRTDANPRRLAEYALNSGRGDRVRHDYDMIKAADRGVA